ncbi:MAG: glycerol-3-phosphate 1-O-acyltransferase PlsY [Bacteroidia bacterium]|nr:glycerol-3-phosphate 1-O-acyltransferase PlsY [Bacteroidia bacterium]MCX7763669.1 glycerol-3-phosphate 1-O-acyltransferase PlsY [Bacteroidia bacterium]MDW8057780.1 glycerol-3-phosphate 1-O-acyltransferase PlsY [Bacteroidia bacterium]
MEVGVAVLVGYLLGAIVPGLWIGYLYGIDIQQVGSGNIGSTNVYRVLGFWPGLIVQIIDIGKALIAVRIAQMLRLNESGLYLTATAAVIGHIYPVWAGFKGGKGINSLLGGMLLIEPLSAIAAVGTFLITLSLSQIVSVSSLTAVGSFLLWHGVVGTGSLSGYLAGVGWLLLVIYTHRSNLHRLLTGTEPKVGQRKR